MAEHRGHRLGLLAKVANLRHLRSAQPDTRWVTSWNAGSNVHMVAINDLLGFVPVDEWDEWRVTI